ncbi:stage II sporulation protein P [Paenibacillus mendelii]|uniref:Stage II sporulation protein P n=1 Tax=Paenibacillus mendelii TaxID=206163 RepID=A0ABV6JHV4_9BACL|nr:stage II sporulation protein P [Paenibacillus mendelii]MCQ6558367.1 stage II sporulation protein P [Paenibacillus mendelii]
MMKQIVVTWNLGKGSRQLRKLLVTGRMFALLSLGSMVMVLVIGVGAIVQQKAASSPVSSMKGFAANVSGGLFSDMLAMEMPGTGTEDTEASISGKQISSFLVRLLTDINPDDPKSLLAGEYPGLKSDDTVLLRPGSVDETFIDPGDHGPIAAVDENEVLPSESGTSPDNGTGDGSGRPDPGAGEDFSPEDGGTAAPPADKPVKPDTAAKPTTGKKKVVFIYHSHNRESWYPELKSGAKDPSSATKNVTLLGKRLKQKLEEEGVGATTSSADYPTAIKKYNWALSYKYSKQTVTEAMASNDQLKFFFDLHRDSLRKKNTTITIKGLPYARVYFVIGHANPNWRKNESFANRIHDALEKDYPGLSKGILGKTTASGNGEYNQSISPGSILIEIGGVDNTLEESYRTIDALAKVISELYWDAEKVSKPIAS